ncbi:MAG: FtsQ-type POTRA domain-containing protein [Treponema sp.]|nr:FtsQ-type POTRA domain-containing protein [Treponema sp.]
MSDFVLLMDEDYNEKIETEVSMPNGPDKPDSEDKKIKVVKIIFFILCFFLAAELVVYKYVIPSFGSPKVTVNGQNSYSAEEIAMLLLPMNSTTWFDFDVDMAASILSSEPGLEKVTVEKKFPDKIYIDVVERMPVALTFVEENGTSYPVQIDRNGVLYPIKNNIVDSNEVPIISGINVEHLSGGMRIASQYKSLIEQIAKIKELGKNYFAGISEICVLPTELGSYELELIPAQSKIKVLTDRSLNEESLKYMMVVLDVINLLDTTVSEVDLRYGSVSCKVR